MPLTGTTLKLHINTDTNEIWTLDEGKPVLIGDDPHSLAFQSMGGVDEVRVLGLHSNAELICWLHQARLSSGYPQTVRVGTPLICSRREREDPAAVLASMAKVDKIGAPSIGGWHDVTEDDFTSYLLVCAIAQSGGAFNDDIEALLKRHPAWPALSFVPTLDMAAAAVLLAMIVDPRWYVSKDRPNRQSKLKTYLGLIESNMSCILAGKPGGLNHERAAYAVRAWSSGKPSATKGGPPNEFLRRCCARQPSQSRGLLRASSLFLSFLRSVWLQGIDRMNMELFVPEHFFEGDDEAFQLLTAQAYRRHAADLLT
jgi:hypothetical protein